MTSACLTVIVIVSLTEAAWAQSGADMSLVVPLHPRVSTRLVFPEEIVHAWLNHHGEIRIARVGNEIGIRPRPGTRAGAEALLEVETATMRFTFQLRVVKRARAARDELVMVAVEPPRDTGEAMPDKQPVPTAESAPDTEPAPSAEPAPNTESAPATEQPAPAAAQSAASEPESGADAAVTAPAAGRDVTSGNERAARAATERDTAASGSRRFELSVHGAVSLAGVTTLEIAGYKPQSGRQPHRAFSMRLEAARPDAQWALRAGVSGEWPVAPMTYGQIASGTEPARTLDVSGPWLQAELGIAARLGRIWMPTIYAELGMLAHLRRTDPNKESPDKDVTETIRHGAVLTLGMGLHRRVQDLLLGVDFQTRYGWPDGYHSMSVFGSVGWILDQGDEP